MTRLWTSEKDDTGMLVICEEITIAAEVPREDDAVLILTAVNACFAINPSDPLAVAREIENVVELLTDATRPHSYKDGQDWQTRCRDTLARLGRPA